MNGHDSTSKPYWDPWSVAFSRGSRAMADSRSIAVAKHHRLNKIKNKNLTKNREAGVVGKYTADRYNKSDKRVRIQRQ